MRIDRALPLVAVVLGALPLGVALPGARVAVAAPPASPERLSIATEAVPMDRLQPGRDQPPRTWQAPRPVELGATPTATLAVAPAPGERVLYGVAESGARRVPVAVATAGETARAWFDGNGDGRFDASEAFGLAPATSSHVPGAARLAVRSWWTPDVAVGTAHLSVGVTDRPAALRAELRRQASKPALAVTFTDGVPSGLRRGPSSESVPVRFGTASADGVTFVCGAAIHPDGRCVLFVDANGDGDLSSPAERVEIAPGRPREKMFGTRAVRVGMSWVARPVASPLGEVVAAVTEEAADTSLTLNAATSRRGRVELPGGAHVLYLLDGDLDGAFTSPDDRWWFRPESPSKRPDPDHMFDPSSPSFSAGGMAGAGGTAWRLVGVGTDGVATVEPLEPAAALAAFDRATRARSERVNALRWFPRFESDVVRGWPKENRIDPSRPKAAAAPVFRFLPTLDDAFALARREGRPLLVDFEADWCVWCKRLDFFTYPDAEVAALLAKFTLVKLNADLDPADSMQRFKDANGREWGGLPCVAVFRPDGTPVRASLKLRNQEGVKNNIPGWLPPAEFVQALGTVHAQWGKPAATDPPFPPPSRSGSDPGGY